MLAEAKYSLQMDTEMSLLVVSDNVTLRGRSLCTTFSRNTTPLDVPGPTCSGCLKVSGDITAALLTVTDWVSTEEVISDTGVVNSLVLLTVFNFTSASCNTFTSSRRGLLVAGEVVTSSTLVRLRLIGRDGLVEVGDGDLEPVVVRLPLLQLVFSIRRLFDLGGSQGELVDEVF